MRGEKKSLLVMRKELTQEMVTYGADLLCPGLPIQISLQAKLRAEHGTVTFISVLASSRNYCHHFKLRAGKVISLSFRGKSDPQIV